MNDHNSNQLNELFAALAKAQSEFVIAAKDKKNHQSTYADLQEVVSASRPALTKYGLAVIQLVQLREDGRSFLLSILGHSSGQCISSEMALVPLKNDPQSMGSAITYARRYSYAALVGVLTGDDDDGHKASGKIEMVHPDNAKYIVNLLKDQPETNKKLLRMLDIPNWNQLPWDEYDDVVEKIEKSLKTLPAPADQD